MRPRYTTDDLCVLASEVQGFLDVEQEGMEKHRKLRTRPFCELKIDNGRTTELHILCLKRTAVAIRFDRNKVTLESCPSGICAAECISQRYISFSTVKQRRPHGISDHLAGQ